LDEGFALMLEEASGVGFDGDAGEVAHLAVVEAEGPEVSGADGAAVFDFAVGEAGAGVGAGVVEGGGDAVGEEDGEAEAFDFYIFSAAFGEFIESAQGYPGHGESL
jgi:hypothetical protein